MEAAALEAVAAADSEVVIAEGTAGVAAADSEVVTAGVAEAAAEVAVAIKQTLTQDPETGPVLRLTAETPTFHGETNATNVNNLNLKELAAVTVEDSAVAEEAVVADSEVVTAEDVAVVSEAAIAEAVAVGSEAATVTAAAEVEDLVGVAAAAQCVEAVAAETDIAPTKT